MNSNLTFPGGNAAEGRPLWHPRPRHRRTRAILTPDEFGLATAAAPPTRFPTARVASCIRELPAEDRQRVKAYEGQIFDVLEIDRYGMVWFGADGGTSVDFSLRPEEVAVVKSD
jgi:hypothetical protein